MLRNAAAKRPILRSAQALAQIDGMWWATRLRDPTWERVLPPQLIFPAGATPRVCSEETTRRQMRIELGSSPQIEIERSRVFDQSVKGQPILVRSKRGHFKLIGTEEDTAHVREQVRSGEIARADWTIAEDLQERFAREGGVVKAVLDAPLNHANRALAKVALSFFCALCRL